MKLSPLENKRLQNINFLMDEIHSLSNEIYECLVDSEYNRLKLETNALIRKLKGLSDSVQDDI